MNYSHKTTDQRVQQIKGKTVRRRQKETRLVWRIAPDFSFPWRVLDCAIVSLVLLAWLGLRSAPALADGPPLNPSWLSIEYDHTNSLAWGDYDGDGDLDLAVGNRSGQPNRLHRNDSGALTASAIWSSSESDSTYGVAWGDYDGDGDLDLAVGNTGYNRLYRNDDGTLTTSAVWASSDSDSTYSVAWGDYDGDGDLDLATGNTGYNRLYRNDDGTLTTSAIWVSSESDSTRSIAWGDYDGDGDLDLAVGNTGYNRLYRNDDGMLTTNAIWVSSESDSTYSVAWGDYDGDGDPDLAVGNYTQPSRLYRNDDGALAESAIWSSTNEGDDWTYSMAWGDYDDDGDLDLAVGNYCPLPNDCHPIRLYHNNGTEPDGTPIFNLVWLSDNVAWVKSIAWGDYDGDGDLDLALGVDGTFGANNQLYRNNGETLIEGAVWSSAESDRTEDVAWGDYDNDGDLDLVVANATSSLGTRHNRLYRNDNGALKLVWMSAEADNSSSAAWGDYDGDGDLDLVVGNDAVPNRLYRNDGTNPDGTPIFNLVWNSSETDATRSVAWGDYDGDGDLDLAVGNGGLTSGQQPNRLYRNDGTNPDGTPILSLVWNSDETDSTWSVAWGDYDDDGDLDLAVGNEMGPNQLYRNDSTNPDDMPILSLIWGSHESDNTGDVAWGDYDGDGDLDLAVGNAGQPDRLYRNNGGMLTESAVWSAAEYDNSGSIAWGDYDGDGDLDLAAGGWGYNRLHRNDGGTLTTDAVWTSAEFDYTNSVAWGDYDGDGDLDLAVGNGENAGQTNRLYHNFRDTKPSLASIPIVQVSRPGLLADADFYSMPRIWSRPTISLTYRLFQRNGLPVQRVAGMYSLNGGGQWLPAVATSSTFTTNLSTATCVTYTYGNNTNTVIPDTGTLTSTLALTATDSIADIDVHINLIHTRNSDLTIRLTSPFSRSVILVNRRGGDGDNFSDTIFDDDASISITSGTPPFSGCYRPEQVFSHFVGYPLTGTWTLSIADQAAGESGALLSWGMTVTLSSGMVHTYTWDVFGSGLMGRYDNIVFRLQTVPAIITKPHQIPGPYLYGSYAATTFPFRVQGSQVRVVNGTMPVPDALVYRLPVGQTTGGQPYANYLGEPFRTDNQGYLQGHGQINVGDQLIALQSIIQTEKYTIYHTSAIPTVMGLEAFTVAQPGVQELTVSADDPLLLFDLDVSLEWDASNDETFLTQLESNLAKTSAALYDWTNGQVALGQVSVHQAKEHWDEADLRIFASNQIRPVANRGGIVSGTAVISITEPITFSQGEIRIGPTWSRYGDPQPIGDDWPDVLAHELGHYALFLEDTYLGLDEDGVLVFTDTCTGTAMTDPYVFSEFRYDDDWQDEKSDWHQGCAHTLAEMPDWEIVTLAYPALHTPLSENTGPTAMPFAFTEIEISAAPNHPDPLLDDPYIPVGESLVNGRAYLIRPGEGLIDLGRPIVDSVLARGAREGDEVCVFADEHFACSHLSNSAAPQLDPQPAWQPEILLTPINTTTLQIQVNVADSDGLTATIYPNGESPQVVTLMPGVVQTVTLTQPAVEVLVDIGGDEPDEQRMMTGYAVGAGPGRTRGHGGPGRTRGHGGPFSSSDGSVIVYPPQGLPNGAFMVLQVATALPELPAALVPIGRAYQVRPSTIVTDFAGASLTFQYLGLDVLLAGGPQAEESLAIHYWDGVTWTRLETALNTTQNFASSPLPGAGLYVLTTGRLAPRITPPISPNSGSSGQTYTLTIMGTSFMEPLTVTLHGDMGSYPLAITSINTQTVLAQTPADLPPDLYNLELTNAGGLTDTLSNAFALYTSLPTNTCFFDDFGSGLAKWTVSGQWDIVTLAGGEEAVTDSPIHPYPSAEDGTILITTITSQPFDLSKCADPVLSFRHDYELVIHDWITVEISTDDGATWQSLVGYTGQEVQRLAAIAPDEEWYPVHWQTTTLNLAEGDVATDATAARLRFKLVADDFASAKGWIIDEVVIESFGVVTPAPQVNGIMPNSGIQGSTISITNLTGADFQSGAAVKLAQVGGNDIITAMHIVVVSATQITCTFDLVGAEIGTWDVVVTNPDWQSGTLPDGFAVVEPNWNYVYLPLIMRNH